MPIARFEMPDGRIARFDVPEGTTPEQAQLAIEKMVKGNAAPTTEQKIQSSWPMRIIQGMRDPINAGAQILSRAVPDVVTDALDYIPSKMRESSIPAVNMFANAYLADPRQKATDQRIRETEQSYEQARKATGNDGADLARVLGNVASPVNAGIARVLPMGALSSLPKMAGTGAAVGATGGALTPVSDENSQQNFLSAKAAQAGTGAVAGAVITPVFGKVLQAAAPHVERAIDSITGKTAEKLMQASLQTDAVLSKALKDLGQTIDDIPKAQYDALRVQVNDALVKGKKLDAAAILRKGDFEAEGLPYTQGQITRDPQQFARERNLRGVAGVGEPLQAAFTGQNQAFQKSIGNLAQGASDKVTAAEKLAGALSGVDKGLKSGVNNAYAMARDNLGRAAPMDAAHMSREANLALDEAMLGHYLPKEVRGILNDITSGKMPFNVNTAVQVDSVLSAAQRTAGHGSAEALAIGKVRDAINNAPIADNIGEGAKKLFDTARGMARERFALHDAIPGLKAAAEGSVNADDFIRKFVINGKTDELRRMAKLLSPPAAYCQIRGLR